MNPTPVRTMDLRVGLKWTAQYHGPNPWAESAVVAGELAGHAHVDLSQVEAACADLWAHSGLQRGDEDPLHQAGGDVLLALGRAATQWAMAVLNEVRGLVLHAGARREGDVVCLWVGFHHAPLSRSALQLALGSLVRLLKGEIDPPALKADLDRLWLSCRQHHPDYQARILMVGAQDMEVPFLGLLPGTRYWQFGWGARSRVFMESSSNADGVLGWRWQQSKATTKALMQVLGLPTPRHVLLTSEQNLSTAVDRVGFPCVVKPLDAGGGKGVTANIRSMADALTAFRAAFVQKRQTVMVETHVAGDDHRLMVINGRLVAAIRREPSFVVGDGRSSIADLLAKLNLPRSSNMVRSRYLRPIPIDDVLHRHLATQSLRLADVPAPGRRVTLRSNANLSTGGMCTDVTDSCHPQVRAMAELLARTAGLATAGIDYLTSDISRPPAATGGAFIEMNTTPGLDACVAAGWSEASIARLVLGDGVGHIPVDLTVLSQAGLDALLERGHSHRLAQGDALVIGDVLHAGETMLGDVAQEPWAAVRAALHNATVARLAVICSAQVLERLGCPVALFRQATVAVLDGQGVLAPQWSEVLGRHSRHALVHEDESDILDRLLNSGMTWPSSNV